MTFARQAGGWYEQRKQYLSNLFLKMQAGSTEPDHPGGEIGIALEGQTIIANISIFNNGLITVPAVNKLSGNEFVLDHRVLAPDEDLTVVLDNYVEKISSPR